MNIRKFFNLKLLLSTLLVMTFITGCKKDLSNGSIEINEAVNSIPSFPLNWETLDNMPGSTIPMPWSNSAATGILSDIRYDFKSSEGWTLVCNAFDPNPSLLMPNPYFVLYNKYKGLLRIYTWITTPGFIASDYVTSKVTLSPNTVNSSMLNYIGHDLIDVSINQPAANKVEATKMSTSTWYASQFEIAYDPKVATSTFEQLGLQWGIGWNSISSISLLGKQTGSLNGTITTPASPAFNLPSIGNTLFQGGLEFAGLSAFTGIFGTPSELDPMGNSLSAGISSAIGGQVKNLFSGIFGGSASSQQVALTLNTNMTLDGTSTNSGSINGTGWQMGIPGISNSQSATGIVPLYNQPLGIFSLSSKPTVYRNRSTPQQIDTGYGVYYQYTETYSKIDADINSLIVFNPNVINGNTDGATISNIKSWIILLKPYYFNGDGESASYSGDIENYFGDIYTSLNPVEGNFISVRPKIFTQSVAVRISFNVVPNNGSPTSMIVKTFLPNVVSQ